MVNINKLKGKIVEKGMSISVLSTNIGMDKATMYRKLNTNGEKFTMAEADLIAKELDLSLDEAVNIFFSQYVA